MNPEIPQDPSEDFESRLTAYLLGELDAKEIEEVETALANNPSLQKLMVELEFTMGLVREVIQKPCESESNPTTSERAQLSDARRTALLNTLRQAPLLSLPKPLPQQESKHWMIPMTVAASLVGLLSFHEFSWSTLLPQTDSAREFALRGLAPLDEQTRASALTESEGKLHLKRTPPQDLSRGKPPGDHFGGTIVATPGIVPPTLQTNPNGRFARDSKSANAESKDRKAVDDFFSYQVATTAPSAPPTLAPEMDAIKAPAAAAIPAERGLHSEALSRASGANERAENAPANDAGEPVATRGIQPVPSKFAKLSARGDLGVEAASRTDLSLHDATPQPLPQLNAGDSLSSVVPPPAPAESPRGGEPNSDPRPMLGFFVQPDLSKGLTQRELGRSESLSKAKPEPFSELAQDKASDPYLDRTLQESVVGQSDSATILSERFGSPIELHVRGKVTANGLESLEARKDAFGLVAPENHLSTKEELESLKPVPLSNDAIIPRFALVAEDKLGEKVEESRRSIKVPSVPVPQPEVSTADTAFSTFSLNVTDVSFKLAAASLENNAVPAPATIRSEEFINAFQYRDPEPASGQPMAFAWDRAASPFSQNRDLLRFSLKTAAIGRESGRPLNVVLLLDKSGSMERPDRVEIVREALVALGKQLKTGDQLSVVTFARMPRLLAEAVPTDVDHVRELAHRIASIPAEGGTNLEEAMKLAYTTASKHFLPDGLNRVVLLTDGAANLGEVEPASLQVLVESWRQRGIALDCFGIGWEGLNDPLLATMASHGDGRYGLINSAQEAETSFATQLAGALQVAASDVKVQVEFNPQRVSTWRQIGYATHQLTQEQFRDNRVDAAELAAAESGNALYAIQVQSRGSGPIATVRARFRDPVANVYRELSWTVPFSGAAQPLNSSAPRMRLAATAALFSEWLAQSPHAAEVTPTRLLSTLQGVPESFSQDPLPKKLESMIRQAQLLTGK